eukprot:14747017-Heterocapsa_arctica.AAC.1
MHSYVKLDHDNLEMVTRSCEEKRDFKLRNNVRMELECEVRVAPRDCTDSGTTSSTGQSNYTLDIKSKNGTICMDLASLSSTSMNYTHDAKSIDVMVDAHETLHAHHGPCIQHDGELPEHMRFDHHHELRRERRGPEER